MQFKRLLPFVLFLVVLAFLGKGLLLDPHEVPSPLIGKPAPLFIAPTLENTNHNLSTAQMKGKVWLLNVWASWCGACREEHPVLLEMSSQGLPLYGLNYKDTNIEAQNVLDQMGDPYIQTATDANGKIGIDFGVYGVPETYIIDKSGVIRYKQIGPITEAVLTEKILPMLKELEK
jgi:cytochrome c biogenesis protein CcmG, thiol:disulfide interchange protein DsbE